jgi:hypothetical protein
MTDKKRRSSLQWPTLVAYWQENWKKDFPDLLVSRYGWGEPLCFRCGWLAPVDDEVDSWRRVAGWLEKAHLHDFSSGGPDNPSNIVPLCSLCHYDMPDFPDSRDEAVAWVAEQGHDCCPQDWQQFTDRAWMGRPTLPRGEFRKVHYRWIRQCDQAKRATELLRDGQVEDAEVMMRRAGVPTHLIGDLVANYQRERQAELAGAAA